MKKKLGRPRKAEGLISRRDFARAGIVMSLYDEARKNGQKHSMAVRETVDFVKKPYPKMRISETGLKRILAKFRPRNSQTILRFERSTLTAEELAKFRWMQGILAAYWHDKESILQPPSPLSPIGPVTTFKFRFGERPNFPRTNRKSPKK
jgi:hypothetical protein